MKIKTLPIQELHPGKGPLTAEIKEILAGFSNGVNEVVNFGTHILKWDVELASGSDENIPIFMIFRNILENLDAIAILIRESSVDPCKSLLRVALEAVLNLEYLLKGNLHRNGLAFLVCTYHKELKLCQQLSDGSQQYSQLRGKLQSDKTLPDDILPPEINGLSAHVENIERMLGLPLYGEVEAEYQRLKSMGINNPAWHQLFEGPRTIENLAKDVNRQGLYEVLYRGWSGSVHGADILKGKFGMVDGDFTVTQIRYLKDVQMVTQYAVSMGIIAFNVLISQRIPSRQPNLDKWYLSIRDFYLSLVTKNII